MSSMINEKRLFSLIGNFFAHPEKVIYELAQNAARSKATRMDIMMEGGCLVVKDNGNGMKDYKPLLVVSESDWDKDVEENQMPAGWGNYYLIALSNKVTYRSLFGSLSIDCPKFLKDTNYRNSIFSQIDKKDISDGFEVRAKLLPEVEGKVRLHSCNLSFFPMDVTIDGKAVKKASIERLMSEYDIQTKYQGNHIGINISREVFTSTKCFLPHLETVWYGLPITYSVYRDVFLVVNTASPVTPVLPFRHEIKNDEKASELQRFVTIETINYCISILNNPHSHDKHKLLKASEILSDHATQEELNRLAYFCVTTSEPYHNEGTWGEVSNKIVLADRKNAVVVNESIKLYINGEEEEERDGLYLPKGVIIKADIPKRKPSWLKIENKKYVIRVYTAGMSHSGYYQWEKATISCKEKSIKTLALISYPGDGTVYYSDNPSEFYDMSDVVFANAEYDEDGDRADAQEADFEERISEDIQNITGEYVVHDIFRGFYDVLNIRAGNIVSVVFNKDAKKLTIETREQGETAIKERQLKVA